MANARKIAVNALLRVNCDKAYSNITLNEFLNSADITPADKALATTLFYGVLDRKITLDYILSTLIKVGFSKVKPFTKEVLRVGLYQILYLEKIPQSAAVNEAVKLIKKSKESYNSGFVNAVLRNAIRQTISLPSGDSKKDLSIRYSCPEWIIENLLNDYETNEVIEFLEQSLKSPPLFLRVNNTKITDNELTAILKSGGCEIAAGEIDNSLQIISGGINTERSEAYRLGYFHVQDISSQKCVAILNPKKGERILDMCAAPGGKSFTICEHLENIGEVVSCDIYPQRTKLILNGAKRLGLSAIKPTVCDATEFKNDLGKFDAILCDVPCSGLGIMRRKPDIKYKDECDFEKLQETQLKILNNAVNYLKEKGRIVYSTCTVRKAENERIVEKFLNMHSEFILKEMKTYMPSPQSGDGFFTALLVRE